MRDHILYAGTEWDCRIFDVTDPAAPVELGRIQSACMKIELLGDVLYSLDPWPYPLEVQLFDVSHPTDPSPLGTLRAIAPPTGPGPNPARLSALAVEPGLAHVATDISSLYQGPHSWLQAVDTRVQERPRRSELEWNYYQTVEVEGDHLYATAGSILDVFHLDDALHPSLVGEVTVPAFGFDLEVVGTLVYVASLSNLSVVDVADPSRPRVVASVASRARSVERAGNHLYVGTLGSEIEVYDISTPTSPARLGSPSPTWTSPETCSTRPSH